MFGLCLGAVCAQDTDSLRFYNLLRPPDTIGFNEIYEGMYGKTPEVLRNQRMRESKLTRGFLLVDSVPEYQVYLYANGQSNATGISEFRLCYRRHDTLLVSSFATEWPANLLDLAVVESSAQPIVSLDYLEYRSNGSGSTEMEVMAFFALDGFCLPLARVIRKLWLSENGNYDPECKDYQYYSVEFVREVGFRNNMLHLGPGDYKYSENLNCEVINGHHQISGATYAMSDYLLLRR